MSLFITATVCIMFSLSFVCVYLVNFVEYMHTLSFVELQYLINLGIERWHKLNIILYWHFSLRSSPCPTYYVRTCLVKEFVV